MMRNNDMILWGIIGIISFFAFRGVISIPGITPIDNTTNVPIINTSNLSVSEASALASYNEFKNRPSSYTEAKEEKSGSNAVIGWSMVSFVALIGGIYLFFYLRLGKAIWRWWKSHFEKMEAHYKTKRKKNESKRTA